MEHIHLPDFLVVVIGYAPTMYYVGCTDFRAYRTVGMMIPPVADAR